MKFVISTIRQVNKLVVLFVFLFVISMAAMPVLAEGVDGGLGQTMGQVNDDNKAALGYGQNKPPLDQRVGTLIGTVLSYVGVIFFVLIVYGGLMWMTAQGNDQKVAKAKELIINATIGLIIVLSAYAITSFIGTTATDISV